MILTEFQKKIIDKIISGKITDIASFLKWKYDDKKVKVIRHDEFLLDPDNKKYRLDFSFQKYDNEQINFNFRDLPDKSDIYFVEDFYLIGEFIALWNRLEKEGYIISTKCILNSSQLACYVKRKKVIDITSTFSAMNLKEYIKSIDKFNKFIEEQYQDLSPEERKNRANELITKVEEQNEKNFTYEKANELLNLHTFEDKYREDYFFLEANNELVGVYIDKQIIPLIDLKELKKNKYQSISDLRFKKERIDRIIAQLITVLIAVFTLLFNFHFSKGGNNTQNQLNENIKKMYQSQEKLNDFYLKYDKVLNQLIK